MHDLSDPVAILAVSTARRVFGAAIQIGLGGLLIVTAAGIPDPHPLALFLLIGVGLLCLWGAWQMFRATDRDLVLTREGLFESTGRPLALMSDIASVDRGVFAFKPSNGFLIRLKDPAPRAWVPGLWWRVGRRIGVGGATNGKAARHMADIITLLLADPRAGLRDGPDED